MNEDMMNINEITRLTEWLKAKGHTDTEIIECIQYIRNAATAKRKAYCTNSEKVTQ